ncbi:hypothetical protein H5T88_02545 [bacterium]|nr:hypothetical protein [bacterium]
MNRERISQEGLLFPEDAVVGDSKKVSLIFRNAIPEIPDTAVMRIPMITRGKAFY